MRLTSSSALISLIVGLLALTGSVYALTMAKTSTAAPPVQAGTALSTDDCIEIDQNDSVQISLYIDNSPALFAFEIYFAYDPSLLEVVDRNVRLFLSEGPNSNVFDFSDAVPNSTGLYRLGAADVALGATAETGDGTLATITLRARDDGVSPAVIVRSNGFIGPRLTTVGGAKIDDTNGDEIFDGSIDSGQIAIDTSCNPVAPTVKPGIVQTPVPTQPPGASGGGTSTPVSTDPGATATPTDGPPIVINGSPFPSPGSEPTSDPDATGEPDDSATPTASPSATNDTGGGIGGGGAVGSGGADNTFWAIVLIGGGVATGLVITYVFARMTRRLA